MNLLQLDTGGRPFTNDDILTLQTEAHDAIESPLQGAPAMVLSGCVVSRAPGAATGDISAGYIWIAGQICRYLGANGVTFPAEVVAGPADDTDFRPYQTGGSKACMSELTLVTQPDGTAPAGTQRVLFQRGATRTYAKWVESLTRQLGDLQDSVAPAPTADIIDPTGRGLADGPRAGWALANGNAANGTADLRKLWRVAYSDNPTDAGGDYDTVGKTGGAESVTLTIAQMPAHTHPYVDKYHAETRDTDAGSNARPYQERNDNKTTGSTGGNQAHENRPPYYVTVVWQWIGLD
jgi:hypothetical protein